MARPKSRLGSPSLDAVASNITSSAQFRTVVTAIEKSVSIFQPAASPEIRAQVGKYLDQASGPQSAPPSTGSAPATVGEDLLKPWSVTCDRQCFGFPAGTQLVAINVPYHQLLLARMGGRLKIISAVPLSSAGNSPKPQETPSAGPPSDSR